MFYYRDALPFFKLAALPLFLVGLGPSVKMVSFKMAMVTYCSQPDETKLPSEKMVAPENIEGHDVVTICRI